eukprot:31477-Pelagococcus_subviridis.AAC.11
MAHSRHWSALDAPASAWYVPGGQLRHSGSASSSPYCPGGHTLHCPAPAADLVPIGHFRHWSPEVAFSVGRKNPASHGEHAIVPTWSAYEPVGQSAQSSAPGSFANVPTGHGIASALLLLPGCGKKNPRGTGTHARKPSASAYVPRGHRSHAPAPGVGEYVPYGSVPHGWQSSGSCEPVNGRNNPAEQGVHDVAPKNVLYRPSGHSAHSDMPGFGATVPGPHATHCDDEFPPVSPYTVPAAHGSHDDDRGLDANDPAGHGEHSAVPGAAANVPTSHGRH